MQSQSNARVLAPMALVAGLLALAVAVVTSGVLGSGGVSTSVSTPGNSSTAITQTNTAPKPVAVKPPTAKPTIYTVKPGDLLSTISEKTGTSVAKLIELNPDVDPQVLVSGQKLKLK